MKYLILSLAFGCSAFAADTTKTATKQLGADFNTVVDFDKTSSVLDASDKEKLTGLVSKAKQAGDLDKVLVAVWSDSEYPAAGQKLSDNDRELAKVRAEAIRDTLKKELKVDNVDIYNMAENANWLSRALNTSDAKVKKELVKTGVAPMTEEQLGIFRTNAKAGKAVVMAVLDK